MIAAILGCCLGVFTGLVPGLGLFTGLLLVYPWLQTLDIKDLIIFYISMAAASQYVGSISAILLQIPGEMNSIFALKEAKILTKENRLGEALGTSAIGSLVGGVSAVFLTSIALTFLESFVPYLFRSDLKAIILICSLAVFIWLADNKLITNCFLTILGFSISLIGISPFGTERTFGYDFLLSGISWYPLTLGLWVIPQLVHSNLSTTSIKVVNSKLHFYPWVSARASIIGYVGGLVPGISYIIGTKMAWLLESKLSNDSLKRLLAAETANNASAYSMILPLLLLSIPIISSEALILELANNRGFQFNWTTVVQSGWFSSLLIPVLLINLSLAAISFFSANYLVMWVKIPGLKSIVTILLLLSLYLSSYNLLVDIAIFIISLIIGLYFKRVDFTPITMFVLLGDQLEQNFTRILVINGLI